MGMLKPCGDPDFAFEPLRAYLAREFRRQDLDYDSPAKGALFREKDAAHPATPKLALDREGAPQGGMEMIAKRIVEIDGWRHGVVGARGEKLQYDGMPPT